MLTSSQIADVLWALSEAREYLDGQSDVIDGDYGEPAPNRAMQICNLLDEAHALMEREFEGDKPVQPFPFVSA